MLVDLLKTMGHVSWMVAYALELWLQGQIHVLQWLASNFYAFQCGILIFGIWLDHLNQFGKFGFIVTAAPKEMHFVSMISSFSQHVNYWMLLKLDKKFIEKKWKSNLLPLWILDVTRITSLIFWVWLKVTMKMLIIGIQLCVIWVILICFYLTDRKSRLDFMVILSSSSIFK